MPNNPQEIIIKFTDGAVHNASVSEASISQLLCSNYGWSISPVSIGLDSAPKYTIEVSNNDSTWQPYSPETDAAAIDQGFDDSHLVWKYIRINYNADTNTTGTVAFTFTLKRG